MTEIETKIDEIDIVEIKKILDVNTLLVKDRKLMKRWIFNLGNEKDVDEFVRIRSDGKISTLTYKRRSGSGLANTEEIETEIGDFDIAAKIFSKIVNENYYQENFRTTYKYKDAEITIDEWPKLLPILEIEAESEEAIRSVIDELGIHGKELGNIGWEKVYAMHGIELHSFKVLKFDN
ncbi:MAG: CYTH domain-containing protein [Candidatus Marsarchaeota archaeon]|nr:CYTH domain-containing protein [Candidatus Marsarchaeota archaeon]